MKKSKTGVYSNPFTSLGIGNLNGGQDSVIAPEEPQSATRISLDNEMMSPRGVAGSRSDALTVEEDRQRREKMALEYLRHKV